MPRKKTLPKIEVGQTIYVSIYEFLGDNKPNLREYEVTKINRTSIYAVPKNSDDREPIRFNRRTLTYEPFFGTIYTGYLSEEFYWKKVAEREEIEKLQREIKEKLSRASLKVLREIARILEGN